jgi:hypothetical protein
MLTLSVTATSVDKGATFALSCTDVGNGATAYEWTLPEGLTGSSTTNTIKVTASTIGMYAANQIKVTATNACGSMTATGSGGAITVVLCSGATVYNGAYNGPAAGAYNTSYGGTFSANWTASAFTAQGKDLCWAASDISGKKTWEAATEACAGDWRLPNLKELQVLYEAIGGTGKSSATALTALDTKGTGTANGASAMQSVISNYYFSSTEASSDLAYTFIFNNGARYSRNKTTSYYVRCVRSL